MTAQEIAQALGGRRAGKEWLARCPAHNDQNPSLSIADGPDGKVLLKCFAGCSQEAVIAALRARKLWPEPGNGRVRRIAATYNYTDADGRLLFQVLRLEPKDFRQRRPCPHGGDCQEKTAEGRRACHRDPDGSWWHWDVPADLRVLYRLSELLQAVKAGQRVYVTEGEKDADNLRALGLSATTAPMGAGKWQPSYSDTLRGAHVVILPDKDEPGRKHAQHVAHCLHGVAASVKVLELPGEAKDVSDWLAAGGTPEELERLADQAPQWAPPASEPPPKDRGDGRRSRSKSDLLAQLAQAAELWHDPEGEPWATVVVDGHRENWPTHSGTFCRWLSKIFYQAEKRAPGIQAIHDALLVIDGVAWNEGPQHPVHVRLAEHDGRLYLDLGDEAWRAVEITPDGWRVLSSQEVPVRFRRARGMLALPEPVAGGSLELLRRYLHVPDEAAWLVIRAWMVGALHPRGPYPVLVLQGEQGSGKSLTARMLRTLIDPNTAPLRTSPRNEEDLVIAARNGWVVTLDNLSALSDWLSDALCRLATGGALSKRALYTDADEALIDVRRPVILNGIDDLAARDDLRDRAIVITLPPIPEHERREESELWAGFEADRPAVLGALLDAVAAAMRYRAQTRLDRLPRMADFARWVAAAGRAAGWTPQQFLAAYTANRDEAAAAGVEASPVGQAIRALVEKRGSWEGTATELRNALAEHVEDPNRMLPRSPRTLASHVRRLAPALRAVGVGVEERRTSHARLLRLTCNRRAEHAGNPPSPASPPPQPASPRPSDGGDGAQAIVTSRAPTVTAPGRPGGSDGGGTTSGDGVTADGPAANPRHDGACDRGDHGDDAAQASSARDLGVGQVREDGWVVGWV